MILIREALQLGRDKLAKAKVDLPALEARLLLAHVLSMPIEKTLALSFETLSKNKLQKFFRLIELREKSMPIAYLIGKKEFYNLDFKVDKNTLIPRPDSETLIDAAIRSFEASSKISILDLGTGSGCLLLTLLKHFPNARGVGVDISKGAINIARSNYAKLEIKNPVKFIAKSWNELNFDYKFDLIISNPPYIAESEISSLQPDVKDYEPQLALCGGEDGLKCYREILPIIERFLKHDGVALIECGASQHRDIIQMLAPHNLKLVKKLEDLKGITRCILASFTAVLPQASLNTSLL